jgi:tetratricopeptide (TPR) repeat protein
MTVEWGNLHPIHPGKSPVQKALDWAKAHQEWVAVSGILLVLLGVGIPYYLHSQAKQESDAQGVLSLGQYYLHAQVDPKNGPFKTVVERDQQALKTFTRITTDYSGTATAKLAGFYQAKCQYDLGQYTQAYSSFEKAAQDLKGTPLGDESHLGKILCLEAQGQFPQAAVLAAAFLKDHPDSFLAAEMGLTLSDAYLKANDKSKALEELKRISQTYAGSDWAKEADRRIKDMQT